LITKNKTTEKRIGGLRKKSKKTHRLAQDKQMNKKIKHGSQKRRKLRGICLPTPARLERKKNWPPEDLGRKRPHVAWNGGA